MPDSVVIDPFRYLQVHDNITYIPLGKNNGKTNLADDQIKIK